MIRALMTVFALLLAGGVAAHKPSDAYLTVERSGATLQGQWDIALRDLDNAIGLDANGDGEITWRGPLAYHVFDIMWLDGLDVTSLPLEDRSALLSELPLAPPLHRVVALNDEAPWERAQKEGWEGVIAKRRGSLYEQRRSPNWLKMKCELAQEFVVGGFTDPQGKRVGLGALLVGYYDGDDFVFARLQHERAHRQPRPPFPASDHDRWIGISQQLRNFLGRERNFGVPGDLHVRHVIGNFGREERSTHAGNFCQLP